MLEDAGRARISANPFRDSFRIARMRAIDCLSTRDHRGNCVLLALIVAHLLKPEPKTRSPAWLFHKC